MVNSTSCSREIAVDGDGKATHRDGPLPPVSAVAPHDRNVTGDLSVELREASRHVAEINERHAVVRSRITRTLTTLAANGSKAIDSLERRINKWLRDEGVAGISGVVHDAGAQEKAETGFDAFEHVMEHVFEEGSPAGIAIGAARDVAAFVAGIVLEQRTERAMEDNKEGASQQVRQASEHASSVHLDAIAAYLATLDRALSNDSGALDEISMTQIPSLFGRLATAMADADRGVTETGRIVHDEAESVVANYIEKEGLMWPHLANAETFGATIIPKCDAAFDRLVDAYIAQRGKQNASKARPGTLDETGAGGAQVVVVGEFDLNNEPPVQFRSLDIHGLGNVSSTVWEHLAMKRLVELPATCDVTFELHAPPVGQLGFVWTHQHLYMSGVSEQAVTELQPDNGLERLRAFLLESRIGEGISQ